MTAKPSEKQESSKYQIEIKDSELHIDLIGDWASDIEFPDDFDEKIEKLIQQQEIIRLFM